MTALLAGSAASFLRAQEQRCQIKRSLGDAGLEMKFLREIWQCLQPEPDRAVAIVCGSLGKFDDGDAEATIRRLWHRAIRLLRQTAIRAKLDRLTRELERTGRLTGDKVERLLGSR